MPKGVTFLCAVDILFSHFLHFSLSVAAGAKETTTGVGFAGYTYMQDLDKTKCESIPVGAEGRLIDRRDDKIYFVAKLRNKTDDNALCWMTQNLDYDGGSVAGYSGSDVATLKKGTDFSSSTKSQKLYYDPGEYVYTLKSTASQCTDQDLTDGLSACTNNGWKPLDTVTNSDISGTVDISGWTATDDPSFINATSYPSMDGRETCQKTAGSLVGNSGQYMYCDVYYYTYPMSYEHYLIGNYYNWQAATNGSGNSLTSNNVEASKSICPTGWSLPLSGSANNGNDGSYYKLVNGLSYTQLTVNPYYFIRGGRINATALNNAGNFAYYWSATSASSEAYYLSFYNSSVNPLDHNDRSYGLSVRCVAR